MLALQLAVHTCILKYITGMTHGNSWLNHQCSCMRADPQFSYLQCKKILGQRSQLLGALAMQSLHGLSPRGPGLQLHEMDSSLMLLQPSLVFLLQFSSLSLLLARVYMHADHLQPEALVSPQPSNSLSSLLKLAGVFSISEASSKRLNICWKCAITAPQLQSSASKVSCKPGCNPVSSPLI